jgi:lycopene beta-cyclase
VVEEVLRQERGVLPMPWSTLEQPAPERSPLSAGYRGGFFHPATGYSLPIALRLACHVAQQFPNVFGEPMRALHREHRSQARYAQRLNALLFHAFPPAAMWNVFARFYRLPDALIERFYALQLTALDRARILIGRPPKGFSVAQMFSHMRSARPLGAT